MSVRCGRPMLKNRGDTWTFSAFHIIIKKLRKIKKKKAVVSPLQCDMNIIHNNMSVTCGRPMLKNNIIMLKLKGCHMDVYGANAKQG